MAIYNEVGGLVLDWAVMRYDQVEIVGCFVHALLHHAVQH